MRYVIRDDFDIDPVRYFEVFFDEAFNVALFQHLGIAYRLVRLERHGGQGAPALSGSDLVIDRVIELRPEREIPVALRRVVQGAIVYTEVDHYVARDQRMEVVTSTPALGDRLHTRGTYRLEVLGPHKVRRIWEGECVCRIPLLGGLVEKHIVGEVEESYRKTTAFMRAYLAKLGPAG